MADCLYRKIHNLKSQFALRCKCIAVVIFVWGIYTNGGAQSGPAALFLTWESDPTTTMVIEWHKKMSPTQSSILYYRPASGKDWQSVPARPIPTNESDRTIFKKMLTGLQPDTRYEFHLDTIGQVYRFHTLPTEIHQNPVVFAVGGDSFEGRPRTRTDRIDRFKKIISSYEPEFILWSHEIPRDKSSVLSTEWHKWLDAIQEVLINENGRITPIVFPAEYFHPNVSLVNSEPASISNSEEVSLFLSHTIPLSSPSGKSQRIRVMDFGEYLSILLVAGHTGHYPSHLQQVKKQLRKRKRKPHLFVANSPMIYPAQPASETALSDAEKTNWTDLYDRFKVPVVFEFQDKWYKRTIPLKAGKPDPEGTIYLSDGDGDEGMPESYAQDTSSALFASAIAGNHVILVSLQGRQRYIRVVNEYGKIMDEIPQIFEQPVFEHPISTFLPKGGMTLSAEIAEFRGAAFQATDYSGFSRGGFVWFDTQQGHGRAIWHLPVHNTDFFTLRFRYSYAAEDTAYLQLVVNDEVIEDHFQFQSSGKENRWEKSTLINTPLKRGINRLEIRSIPGIPAPRIDRIEIFPSVY